MRLPKIALIFIAGLASIFLIKAFVDAEASQAEYFEYLNSVTPDSIAKITIKVEYSSNCKKSFEIDKNRFSEFLQVIKSSSSLEQTEKYLVIDSFSCEVLLKNGTPLCLQIFNSKTYGGIVRFLNCGEFRTKVVDQRSDKILLFISDVCH